MVGLPAFGQARSSGPLEKGDRAALRSLVLLSLEQGDARSTEAVTQGRRAGAKGGGHILLTICTETSLACSLLSSLVVPFIPNMLYMLFLLHSKSLSVCSTMAAFACSVHSCIFSRNMVTFPIRCAGAGLVV